ncbi:MAG: hypothetical protein P8X55_10835 [Desulfosarcinaceae bacterium]
MTHLLIDIRLGVKIRSGKWGCLMARQRKSSLYESIVKVCVWSVRNQAWLAGRIRIYIFGAACVVFLFAFAGILTPKTALLSVFFGGIGILVLIWGLVQQRKNLLLGIQDPKLRKEAHEAMMAYLHQIGHEPSGSENDSATSKEHQGCPGGSDGQACSP